MTTFSRKNYRKQPPIAWQNFENGMLTIIIPSAVALITGFEFTNELFATRLTLFINIGLVAIIKFISMMLGNSQPSVEPKNNNNNMVGILLIVLMAMGFSCTQIDPARGETISFVQAFKHCVTSTSYLAWAYGLSALSLVAVFFTYKTQRVSDNVKLFIYTACLFTLVMAWVYIPGEVQINTTIEQAARGNYFRYPTK